MVQFKKKPPKSSHHGSILKWLIPIAFGIWGTFFLYTHKLLDRHHAATANNKRDHPAQLKQFLVRGGSTTSSKLQANPAVEQQQRRGVEQPEADMEKDHPDERAGGVTLQEAEQACAEAGEREDCITDVMGLGDLSYAKMYIHGREGGNEDGDDDETAGAQEDNSNENENEHEHDNSHGGGSEGAAKDTDTTSHNNQAGIETSTKKPNHDLHHHADGGGGVTLHEAQIACALAIDKGPCIHDVMGIGDISYAGMYEKHADNHLEQHPMVHKLTQSEAETACKPLFVLADRDSCVRHVLGMNDLETARHYVHLLQDAELAILGHMSEGDARNLCDTVVTMDHPDQLETCRIEVQALPSKHVAEHYIELLQKTHDIGSVVSLQDAEKLCHHLKRRETRPDCVAQLKTRTAKEAAAKYFELQEQQGQEGDDQINSNNNNDKNYAGDLQAEPVKGAVTLHEAQVACALAIEKAVCIHDVMGIGDIKYAEMYDKHEPKDGEDTSSVQHHPFTQKEAETACRPLLDADDQKKCMEHVLGMNDQETAQHYVHLLQDAELLEHPEGGVIHEEGAQSLCSVLEEIKVREQCLKDALTFTNIHIAEHYVDLLQQTHDVATLVSQTNAEKLCNHLLRHSRPQCVESLGKLNAKDAATHYYELHQTSGLMVE